MKSNIGKKRVNNDIMILCINGCCKKCGTVQKGENTTRKQELHLKAERKQKIGHYRFNFKNVIQ